MQGIYYKYFTCSSKYFWVFFNSVSKSRLYQIRTKYVQIHIRIFDECIAYVNDASYSSCPIQRRIHIYHNGLRYDKKGNFSDSQINAKNLANVKKGFSEKLCSICQKPLFSWFQVHRNSIQLEYFALKQHLSFMTLFFHFELTVVYLRKYLALVNMWYIYFIDL